MKSYIKLTKKEKQVLKLRKNHTLQQIANKFSVTRNRIRQIELKANKKLAFKPKNGIELLPVMTRKALLQAGIKTIEEAKSESDKELLEIKYIGKKGFKAIRSCSSL